MTKRIVYYGPINNNKNKELFAMAKYYIEENCGDKFYYILPNGKLLTEYRELLLENVVGAFDVNLFTFDDIVDNLLENHLYTFVDGEMKESIISKLLLELKKEEKIIYYSELVDMEGFVKTISGIIGEIKRSLITSEHFNNTILNTPFYREIGLVYSYYEDFLEKNNLIDREESFFKAIEILQHDLSFFDDLDFIIIDEFFDYRPQELALLKEIVKAPVDIYINMPFEMENDSLTVKETINNLKKLGFKIEKTFEKEVVSLEDICNNLSIELVKTPNKYLELKRISQEIKTFYNKGMDLNEIALVVTRPDEYMDTVFKVFDEEKIPCSINEEKFLMNTPIARQFLSIFEVKIKNYDKQSLINRIKSSYFELCTSSERDKIEFFLRKLNFENMGELMYIIANKKEKYREHIKLGKDKYIDKLEFMEYLEKILLDIKREIEIIPNSGSIEDFVAASMKILDNYNIIDKVIEIYNITEDYQLLYRDITTLAKLNETLEKIETGMTIIYNKIKIDEFYDILTRYLEEGIIINNVGNNEGINILTPFTARGTRYKILFIIGLVQGKYPKFQQDTFFFNERTFLPLKKVGLNLKTYEEKLDKESLMFILALTRCKEKLYLSYPESCSGDEENILSMFLDELLNILDKEKVKYTHLNMDYLIKENIEEITTIEEFARHVFYNYYLGKNSTECFNLLNKLDENILDEVIEKNNCEIARAKENFNEYNGVIGDKNIKDDLNKITQNKKASITFFETYGKCPYKFLLSYILNLEQMERFLEDFTPLDRGDLYHETLREYYERYKEDIEKDILGEKYFQVDNTLEEVENIIKMLVNKKETVEIDKLWEIRIENMASTVVDLVKSDLERQRKSKYKLLPKAFEMEVGFEEGGIELVGKIDRIDKVYGTNKYIIYDYKTSSYGIRKVKDMREGVSFQLPVYTMAQNKKDIIAAGYIIISKNKVDFELVKEEEKAIVNKRRGQAVLNEQAWEELKEIVIYHMKEYMKGIKEGDFSINPKECDKYCIYKDICRYDGR